MICVSHLYWRAFWKRPDIRIRMMNEGGSQNNITYVPSVLFALDVVIRVSSLLMYLPPFVLLVYELISQLTCILTRLISDSILNWLQIMVKKSQKQYPCIICISNLQSMFVAKLVALVQRTDCSVGCKFFVLLVVCLLTVPEKYCYVCNTSKLHSGFVPVRLCDARVRWE